MNIFQAQGATRAAMALFNEGNYKAAVVAFKTNLASDERDTVALFHLALSLLIKPQDGIQMDSRKKAQGAQK
jgi:hypothetical protein